MENVDREVNLFGHPKGPLCLLVGGPNLDVDVVSGLSARQVCEAVLQGNGLDERPGERRPGSEWGRRV